MLLILPSSALDNTTLSLVASPLVEISRSLVESVIDHLCAYFSANSKNIDYIPEKQRSFQKKTIIYLYKKRTWNCRSTKML